MQPSIKMTPTKVSKLFGLEVPDTILIDVWDDLDPQAVPKKEVHHFDIVLYKIMALWLSPLTPRKNLLLIGDGGTGKTSAVTQFAARLNIPLYSLGCSGKTRYEHLVGSLQLRSGETVWEDGPLMRAWRHGGIFMANEITRMHPDEQMRLVDALDKNGRITIGETGEVVTQHPNFRFAATGNSGGFGDQTGAYVGEKVSSYAFMDRFMIVPVVPLSEEDEFKLVKNVVPSMDDVTLKGMITLARTVRKSFVTSKDEHGNTGALKITISPRALIDWALAVVQFKTMSGIEPLRLGLEVMVLNGKPDDDKKVVIDLFDKWIKGN